MESDRANDRHCHLRSRDSSSARSVDAERDRYNRLYARGKLTDDEYDAYTAEVAGRKKAAEDELVKLEDAKRYVEYLDTVPRLAEDYLKVI
jgi:hypothetical protein